MATIESQITAASAVEGHVEVFTDLYVDYDGKRFPLKEHNGYRFAPDSLAIWITNESGDIYSSAEQLDREIAYYFPDNDFNSMTAEQLFDEYEAL